MGKALIFCGIKHCGKSTLGKAVSELLALPFRDTDEMLEERFHLTVRELYKSIFTFAFSIIMSGYPNNESNAIALDFSAIPS